MCYRQLSIPDPWTFKKYDEDGDLEATSILHEGQQGNYFVVFDLPTAADQSRDRRVAVLDLRGTSEEIEPQNEGISHIAEHCKKVFKIEKQSLLAKAIDAYEEKSSKSEKFKCLSSLNCITVEAKNFIVFSSHLSLKMTTSEFAQAGA